MEEGWISPSPSTRAGSLRGCNFHGGGPALLVGLALVRGLVSPRVYMGKASPPTQAGSLSRVTRANYIYFPTKPGIRYLRANLEDSHGLMSSSLANCGFEKIYETTISMPKSPKNEDNLKVSSDLPHCRRARGD